MKKINKKPRLPFLLLRLLLSNGNQDHLYGNFELFYEDVLAEKGRTCAWFRIMGQILISTPKLIYAYLYWSFIMFKNSLKITLRNLKRQKTYSFINISGLAVGITCCVLTLLWVQYELSYDKFHDNIDRIHRVVYTNENREWKSHSVPGAAVGFLKENFPEVADAAMTNSVPVKVNFKEKGFFLSGYFVHPSFLKIFSFPVLAGSIEKPFSQLMSIIISEETAQKYFGEEDPIGKSIRANDRADMMVEAVVSIPENSSIKFDFLLSSRIAPPGTKKWENWGPQVYVLLQEGVSYREFNKKITNIHNDHVPQARKINVCIHPFSENHLHDFLGGGLITYVYVFSAMSLFILLIACINFMNLATGRSEARLREIGIKKVVGSTRMQLIKQFMLESILISIISLLLAGLLVAVLLPVFNSVLQYNLELHYLPQFVSGIIGITLITGIVSGIYPALFLSSFKPVKILKGSLYPGKSSSLFRRILVVFQFTTSIAFIVCAVIVFKQLNFIQNKDLGFDKEQVIVFPNQLRNNIKVFKEKILKNPNIESASAISIDFINWGSSSEVGWEGQRPDQKGNFGYNWIDYDFLKTFKIELTEGRFFSPEIQSDYKEACVLNEAAVRSMGMVDPVGREIIRSPKNPQYRKVRKIIGVVKDYNFLTLHGEVRPFCLMPGRSGGFMNVRINPANMPETLSFIKETLDKMAPGHPFEYSFLDEKIDRQYREEQITGKIIMFITVVAVMISCFGLFGLVAFSVERRTKEIGIRKVVGASLVNIIKLLSKEFLMLVLIANIIAWPVSWYIMNKWLQNFAFHTDIKIWIFILAGLTAVIIAFLTVIKQTHKAAAGNPVKSLKYE